MNPINHKRYITLVFLFYNSLTESQVPIKFSTVLFQVVSGLLFSFAGFNAPVVEAPSLPCSLNIRIHPKCNVQYITVYSDRGISELSVAGRTNQNYFRILVWVCTSIVSLCLRCSLSVFYQC